jgi:ribosomal protein S18 acetylase RimI-like enzyme
LRPNETRDLEFLWELHRSTLKEYVEQVRGWDDAEQRRRFVERVRPGRGEIIELDGEPVGYLQVRRDESPIHLQQIEIAPDHQGRGIGGRVIDSLDGPVRLRVFHVNVRARRLYERLGFEKTHETDTHVYMQRWTRSPRPFPIPRCGPGP